MSFVKIEVAIIILLPVMTSLITGVRHWYDLLDKWLYTQKGNELCYAEKLCPIKKNILIKTILDKVSI